MEKLSRIERDFADEGLVRGGMLLLESFNALRLIQSARHAGVVILGVEGFIVTEQATRPQMGHILDLSDLDVSLARSWDVAAQFIETRADRGLHFEVVLDD